MIAGARARLGVAARRRGATRVHADRAPIARRVIDLVARAPVVEIVLVKDGRETGGRVAAGRMAIVKTRGRRGKRRARRRLR
jgi:hypothetical protein